MPAVPLTKVEAQEGAAAAGAGAVHPATALLSLQGREGGRAVSPSHLRPRSGLACGALQAVNLHLHLHLQLSFQWWPHSSLRGGVGSMDCICVAEEGGRCAARSHLVGIVADEGKVGVRVQYAVVPQPAPRHHLRVGGTDDAVVSSRRPVESGWLVSKRCMHCDPISLALSFHRKTGWRKPRSVRAVQGGFW